MILVMFLRHIYHSSMNIKISINFLNTFPAKSYKIQKCHVHSKSAENTTSLTSRIYRNEAIFQRLAFTLNAYDNRTWKNHQKCNMFSLKTNKYRLDLYITNKKENVEHRLQYHNKSKPNSRKNWAYLDFRCSIFAIYSFPIEKSNVLAEKFSPFLLCSFSFDLLCTHIFMFQSQKYNLCKGIKLNSYFSLPSFRELTIKMKWN